MSAGFGSLRLLRVTHIHAILGSMAESLRIISHSMLEIPISGPIRLREIVATPPKMDRNRTNDSRSLSSWPIYRPLIGPMAYPLLMVAALEANVAEGRQMITRRSTKGMISRDGWMRSTNEVIKERCPVNINTNIEWGTQRCC